MAEVAAKEAAALNVVAEVEAMPNEAVGADSVADSRLGSRQAARNAAIAARSHSVVVPGDLVLGQVAGREAQAEQMTARVELENRVQPPELRHQIVTILSTPARERRRRCCCFQS